MSQIWGKFFSERQKSGAGRPPAPLSEALQGRKLAAQGRITGPFGPVFAGKRALQQPFQQVLELDPLLPGGAHL